MDLSLESGFLGADCSFGVCTTRLERWQGAAADGNVIRAWACSLGGPHCMTMRPLVIHYRTRSGEGVLGCGLRL